MTTHTRIRLDPKDRKSLLLDAALDAAVSQGFREFTREEVATRAQASPALVSKYFTTMAALRTAVMRAAIKREVLPIVAEGIVSGDKLAKAAPAELKTKALAQAM